MRLFLPCFLLLLAACNSSGDNKEKDTVTNNSPEAITNKLATAIVPVELRADQIPASLKFRGKLNEAWQWKDKLGDNILITSFVAAFDDKQKSDYGEEGQTAELHAFHFIKKDTAYRILWKITDAEKACPFDITTEFMKGSIMITDLDSNGIAETTIQYKLACRSDVSPAYMKLIMHEDTMKYSLRGPMWIKAGADDKFTVTENDMNLEKLPKKTDEYEQILQSFGRYESEKEFATAPVAFLQHARKQWMKYVKESFE
ncbi:MAG: hypothetical protein J0L56_02330 [Chitinophagales bacterium]|nr:hypothetical protein [Chitinophagales bacterium]